LPGPRENPRNLRLSRFTRFTPVYHYNDNQLNYTLNSAPNSNSYAYTLLFYAPGLLRYFGQPPDTTGWGYNVITNPNNYP